MFKYTQSLAAAPEMSEWMNYVSRWKPQKHILLAMKLIPLEPTTDTLEDPRVRKRARR